MASGMVKAIEEFNSKKDRRSFDQIYLDLRLEFPTLSEKELWNLIGICVKVYGRASGKMKA